MNGFYNKVLHIDLRQRSFEEETTDKVSLHWKYDY